MAPFRPYDPAIGRWTQVDPVYKFHESGYAGMANNPILYNDPMGLDTVAPIPTVVVVASKPRAKEGQGIAPLSNPTTVPTAPAPNAPTTTPTSSPASTAATVASRALGTLILMLIPQPLGNSDMPIYDLDLPDSPPATGKPQSSSGYATITHYRTSGHGHFSVESHHQGSSLHTHLVGGPGQLTTIQTTASTPLLLIYESRKIRIQLPNASGALLYQRSILGTSLGLYNDDTNSCLTHVCNVLREGGVPVPNSLMRQRAWALKLFKHLY